MVLSKSSEEIQSKSWRSVLPVHPAAALLPPMSDAKLKELGEDIKAHGQRTPIVIFVDDKGKHWLLDGISRLETMQRIGLQVIENDALNILVVDWQEIDDVDPVAYVLSANLHRRHLSIKDKRALAGNLLEMFPNKSDRQIAEMVGLSHNTVKVIRREMEGTGQIDQCAVRIGKDKRKQPATKPPKPTCAPENGPVHAGATRSTGRVSRSIIATVNTTSLLVVPISSSAPTVSSRAWSATTSAPPTRPRSNPRFPYYHSGVRHDDKSSAGVASEHRHDRLDLGSTVSGSLDRLDGKRRRSGSKRCQIITSKRCGVRVEH